MYWINKQYKYFSLFKLFEWFEGLKMFQIFRVPHKIISFIPSICNDEQDYTGIKNTHFPWNRLEAVDCTRAGWKVDIWKENQTRETNKTQTSIIFHSIFFRSENNFGGGLTLPQSGLVDHWRLALLQGSNVTNYCTTLIQLGLECLLIEFVPGFLFRTKDSPSRLLSEIRISTIFN